jgi:hypothetical protein
VLFFVSVKAWRSGMTEEGSTRPARTPSFGMAGPARVLNPAAGGRVLGPVDRTGHAPTGWTEHEVRASLQKGNETGPRTPPR